jgi:hypothetical protein
MRKLQTSTNLCLPQVTETKCNHITIDGEQSDVLPDVDDGEQTTGGAGLHLLYSSLGVHLWNYPNLLRLL